MENLIRWLLFLILMGWLGLIVARAEIIERGNISISIRTPNKDVPQLDYEIKAGVKTYYGEVSAFTERENSEHYKGLYLLTKETRQTPDIIFDGWQGEINIREAQGINQQNIYKRIYGLEYLKVQMVANWTHWRSARLMGSVKYDREWVKIGAKTDLNEVLGEIYLGKKFIAKNGYFVHPFIKWNNYGIRDFVQGKVEVGVIF